MNLATSSHTSGIIFCLTKKKNQQLFPPEEGLGRNSVLCQGNVALRKIPVLMKHLLLLSDSCFYCLVSLQSGCFVRAVGFSSPSLFSPPTGADCPTPGGYCLGRCPAALIALAPRAEPASVPLGECLKCTKLGP